MASTVTYHVYSAFLSGAVPKYEDCYTVKEPATNSYVRYKNGNSTTSLREAHRRARRIVDETSEHTGRPVFRGTHAIIVARDARGHAWLEGIYERAEDSAGRDGAAVDCVREQSLVENLERAPAPASEFDRSAQILCDLKNTVRFASPISKINAELDSKGRIERVFIDL